MGQTYLGDSVYAEIERGMIKLYTDNGVHGKENIIYLELTVFQALVNFAARERENIQ